MTNRDLQIERLRACADAVADLRTSGANAYTPEFRSWQDRTRQALAALFEDDHAYVKRFTGLSFCIPRVSLGPGRPVWTNHDQEAYERDLAMAQGTLTDAIEEIDRETKVGKPQPVPAREPTGWARVDRGLDAMRRALDAAENEEDFQGVGLLAREVLISLAQAVFDPDRHRSLDSVEPSDTDAKRMLDAYIAKELTGSANEEVRRHAKAALALAVALQHDRTADFRNAALCVEATYSTVNIVTIVAGRQNVFG